MPPFGEILKMSQNVGVFHRTARAGFPAAGRPPAGIAGAGCAAGFLARRQ
jgi:hypothetical protein